MPKNILVYHGEYAPALVGRLWAHEGHGRQSASFEYDSKWLENGFSIAPDLPLTPGLHHTVANQALFGVFEDAAPDRWGRMLIQRMRRKQAETTKRVPRTVSESQFLLGVSDAGRQGALRFKTAAEGPFLASSADAKVPPLIFLPRLLNATRAVLSDTDSIEDLRLLLVPGSSLGGARPKALLQDSDGRLWIAKFPHLEDEIDIILWEAVALQLAHESGIPTPRWRLETVSGSKVLLLQRFDRSGEGDRIHFVSAMTLLGARDMETHSYMEIADALRVYGSGTSEDLPQLWRRLLFNVLASNVDDHLRNHGFLHDGTGFRLSPAYDLNPVPQDVRPRILATAIFEDGQCSLEVVLEVAEYFDVPADAAREIAAEVGRHVSQWRQTALAMGARPKEVERMASAFEHDDLSKALKLGASVSVSRNPRSGPNPNVS